MAWSELRWDALSAALVLFMQAGFAILQAGLTRPKNGVNIAVMRVAGTIVAVIAFWVCGFGLERGTDAGGVIGTSGFFVLDGRLGFGPASLAWFCLQVGFAAAVAAVVSGAIAERMPFRAHFAITVALVAFIYPIFAHWVWGGGWLARASFIDFAGATTVHSLGGWAALAMIALVGNRTGSYTRRGLPVRIPGASISLASVGMFILWLGWIGWIGGHALTSEVAPSILVLNTVLAGAAGGFTALGASWISDRVADATPAIHGVLAGLVAVSASGNAVAAPAALAIGAGGGATMLLATRLLERFRIDDAVGAIPVHLGGGLWGTLAVAFFADGSAIGEYRSFLDQLRAQLLGAGACAVWGFGTTYLVGRLLGMLTPLRVRPDQELIGLNVSEHHAATEHMDLHDAVDETRRPPVKPVADPFAETALLAVAGDGAILSANPATSAIFGYAEGELRTLALRQLFAGEARDQDVALGPPALREAIGGPARELRGARRTGEELPVEVVVSAPDPRGARSFDAAFTVAIKDISARREKEEGRTRTQVEIRHRFRRELEAVKVRDGTSLPAEHELPRGKIAAALPAGDWFGYTHEPTTGALVFYVGELTGEAGGTAALLSGFASGSGRAADYRHGLLLGDVRYTPERQLQNLAEVLNRIVVQTGKGVMRMPIVLGQLDLPTGTLAWIDAGGTAPIWVRTGKTVRQLGGEGEAIGAASDPRWQARTVDLASGDMIVMCPPGLVGSFGPEGRVLSGRDVKKIILNHAEPAEVRDLIVARAGAVWKERAIGLVGVVAVRVV